MKFKQNFSDTFYLLTSTGQKNLNLFLKIEEYFEFVFSFATFKNDLICSYQMRTDTILSSHESSAFNKEY